ncbi:hypothetical protein ACTXQV_63725, partial [Klebsiella pneumoniae]
RAADERPVPFRPGGRRPLCDAVRLVDINDPTKGLMYDGRIAEDFKLNTGTFVNVGTLRNKVLIQGNLLIQDVCITGQT